MTAAYKEDNNLNQQEIKRVNISQIISVTNYQTLKFDNLRFTKSDFTRANITIANTQKVAYPLSIGTLTFDRCQL